MTRLRHRYMLGAESDYSEITSLYSRAVAEVVITDETSNVSPNPKFFLN